MNTLSLDTLMLCIKAVQRDIAWHEQLAGSEDASDEDVEYHGQYVLDLSRALSELGSLYQDARAGNPGLPELDQLLGS
jgi:NhaP-type Na+/H+ and K+/H+ antiporter